MAASSYQFPVQTFRKEERTGLPLYARIAGFLRREIWDGGASPGAKLPPTRMLAADLGCARKTVVRAYEDLAAEGLVESRTGGGSFVSPTLSPQHPRPKPARAPITLDDDADAFHITGQDASLRLFPANAWARIYHEVITGIPRSHLGYRFTCGYPSLREAIAVHLRMVRGLDVDPGQIIVTHGSQQGLNLVMGALMEPGAAVLLEDPGYDGARSAAVRNQLQAAPVPVDPEGMDLGAIPAEVAAGARAICVTPSCQFPLGGRMSLRRRQELLRFSSRRGAWILEDDYDSEFDFAANHPLSALASMDRGGRVIYLGSFSKSLLPPLRIGYLVAPPEIVDRLTKAKTQLEQVGNTLDQAVLARFMESGLYAKHLRRLRSTHLEIKARVAAALADGAPPGCRVRVPDSGLHIAVAMPSLQAEREAEKRAASQRLPVRAMSAFVTAARPEPAVLVEYRCMNKQDDQRLVRLLNEIVAEAA